MDKYELALAVLQTPAVEKEPRQAAEKVLKEFLESNPSPRYKKKALLFS